MPQGQKTKTPNRSNIVTDFNKDFKKVVHIKNKKKPLKNFREIKLELWKRKLKIFKVNCHR